MTNGVQCKANHSTQNNKLFVPVMNMIMISVICKGNGDTVTTAFCNAQLSSDFSVQLQRMIEL